MKIEPFFIAELSGNHNGKIERAFEIIKAAKKSGASAVKIQTYTADTMTLNVDNEFFKINDPKSLWHGRKLYELYKEAHTPWDWHEELFRYSRELGIMLFSTPFDQTAVDFLETLNNPIYKIASFELVDIPLIEYVAKTKKPMIMSTGIATYDEIGEAVQAARDNGCVDLTLLHCVSSYPAHPEDSNLQTILALKNDFNVKVGLSDHTLGIGTSIAAIALGADVIEKHFTISRSDGGVDAAFSLEPDEFSNLVRDGKIARESIGVVKFRRAPSENIKQRQFARSLFVVQNVSVGDLVTEENVRSIRPGNGAAPKYLKSFLGRKFSRAVQKGTPMVENFLD